MISHVYLQEALRLHGRLAQIRTNSFRIRGGRILTVVTVPAGALDIPDHEQLGPRRNEAAQWSGVHYIFVKSLDFPLPLPASKMGIPSSSGEEVHWTAI